MRVKWIHKEDYQTTRWSGGTASQVMIWPEHADFKSREFMWRISLATLEDETSVFTPFPGFQRILYLLNGISSLTFQGMNAVEKRTVTLSPGEQVRFDGNWKTGSRGQASDLNLIMKQGVCGSIVTLEIGEEQRLWTRPILYAGPESRCGYFLYVRTGVLQIDGCRVPCGDSVFVLAEENEECLHMELRAEGESCVCAECAVCW